MSQSLLHPNVLAPGGVAAGGLVLVRARQQQKKRQATGLQALEKSIRGVADDIEKRLKR